MDASKDKMPEESAERLALLVQTAMEIIVNDTLKVAPEITVSEDFHNYLVSELAAMVWRGISCALFAYKEGLIATIGTTERKEPR